MLYIAKKVPCEWQESSDWKDDISNGFYMVFGNKDYRQYTSPLFDKILEYRGIIAELEDLDNDERQENLCDIFHDESCIDHIKNLSEMDINAIIEAANESYLQGKYYQSLCCILSTLSGEKWDYQEIHGATQSEWNYLFYKEEEKPFISDFEISYFNMGTEYDITEDGEDLFSVYCYSWNIEGQIEEIKRAICFDEKEDELKVYDVKMVYKPEYVEMEI